MRHSGQALGNYSGGSTRSTFKQFSFFIAVVATSTTAQTSPPLFTISVQPPGSVTLLPCETAPNPDGLRVVSKKSRSETSYYEVCPGLRGGDHVSNGTVLKVSLERCSGYSDLFACDSDPSTGANHCANGMPSQSDWAYHSAGNQTCVRQWNWGNEIWLHENCTTLPEGERRPTLLLPFDSTSSRGGNYNIMTRGNGTFQLTVSDNAGRASKVVPSSASGNGGKVIVQGGVRDVSGSPYVVTGLITIEWHPSELIGHSQGEPMALSVVHEAYVVDLDEAEAVHSNTPHPCLHTFCGLSMAVSILPPSAVTVIPLEVATSNSPLQHLPLAVDVKSGGGASVLHTFDGNNIRPNRRYSITVVALCDSTCLKMADPQGPCKTGTCTTQTYVYAPVIVKSLPSRPASGSSSMLLAFTFWVVVVAVIFLIATGLKILHDKGILADTLGYGPRDQSLSTPYVDALGGGGGRRWTWGYTQLGFTEMVNTSTFGSSRGINSRGDDGREVDVDGEERVVDGVQPIRQHLIADRSAQILGVISDGTAAVAAGAVSFSVTAGSAISDTASALLSYFGTRSGGRDRVRGRESSYSADMDSSTHPLTARRGQNRGGYRPPSPVLTANKDTPDATSDSVHSPLAKPDILKNETDEVCIALTDIHTRSRAQDSPSYTSFPTNEEGEQPLGDE